MKKQFLSYFKKFSIASCGMMLLLSCGKEIETTNDDDTVVRRPAADASKINLKIKTESDNTGSTEYVSEMSGWARIPSKPFIHQSIASIIYSKLSFQIPNGKEVTNGLMLVCDYISSKKSEFFEKEDIYNHQFIGCKEDVDQDGIPDELNYIPGDEVPIDKNQLIIFSVHSSDKSDQLEVESDIEVNWR